MDSWPFCIYTELVTIPHICHLDHLYIGGEKIGHVKKFQISIHDRCGEIWNFSTWRGISVFLHNRCGKMWIFAKFGEISHFSTGQMWRNLKFIQFFVIKSVLRCFCEIRFGAIYALLRGEKLSQKNWIGGEKMTNMRYV